MVSCSDDDVGTIAPNSLDLIHFAHALTADATITVDFDTNGADLDLDANTLFLDSSENRIGIGTATPAVALDVVGDVRATGTITADGGMDLRMGSLDQSPADPVLVGSLGLGTFPESVFVSGRYAYVVDSGSDDLKVIDVTGAEFSSAIALRSTPHAFRATVSGDGTVGEVSSGPIALELCRASPEWDGGYRGPLGSRNGWGVVQG